MILVTAHRRESWGEGLERICRAIHRIASANPCSSLIFPVHLNPRIREPVHRLLGKVENVCLTEPVSYLEFVYLMKKAHFILTDSGGVQEEAPSIGKPVLVMRDSTERPEAVEAGTVRLVGTNVANIVAESERLLQDDLAYNSMVTAVNPYGDGRASKHIVDALLRSYL